MDTLTHLFGAITAGVVFLVVLWAFNRRARGKRPPVASSFGWVLLFLSSGRMPPPPPQAQIEQEAGERKNREISRVVPRGPNDV